MGEHVHVEGNARFKFGRAEHLLHQQRRVDRAALGLQHHADILGGFIAHIGQQRQLLGGEQLGDLLDQPALLHEIGNLGDDDLPGAPRQLFLSPAGAHAEAAAAGAVGLDDRGAVIDDDAARWEVRPLYQIGDLLIRGGRRLDQMQCRIAQLGGIVRRNGGRHAHSDAG